MLSKNTIYFGLLVLFMITQSFQCNDEWESGPIVLNINTMDENQNLLPNVLIGLFENSFENQGHCLLDTFYTDQHGLRTFSFLNDFPIDNYIVYSLPIGMKQSENFKFGPIGDFDFTLSTKKSEKLISLDVILNDFDRIEIKSVRESSGTPGDCPSNNLSEIPRYLNHVLVTPNTNTSFELEAINNESNFLKVTWFKNDELVKDSTIIVEVAEIPISVTIE